MKLSVFSFILFALFALSSCEKGFDLLKTDPKNEFGKNDSDKKGCFDLIYPVTYIMPDASTVTGNTEEELWAAIKAWYEAHPDVAAKPVLQYPVEIVFEDGTTQAIVNEEEMIEAKEGCWDDKEG